MGRDNLGPKRECRTVITNCLLVPLDAVQRYREGRVRTVNSGGGGTGVSAGGGAGGMGAGPGGGSTPPATY